MSAQAQSEANIQTAIANARLNRINQTTPWGSLTYTQTGTDEHGVPIYSSQIALSPQQQALLEQQQHGQLTRSQLANSVLSNGAANIAKPLDLSSLASIYDPYNASHKWDGPSFAAPQGSAPPPPQAPSPQGQPAPQGQGSQPQLQALAAMLRSGSTPTPSATTPATAPEATGDPFGTWGNLNSMIGTTKPDTSKLPPEIAAQLQDDVRVDEGGAQTHNYSFNQNPWGGFKDENGQTWVQVGDPKSNHAADGGIKDHSKVVYKPGAGFVTTPDNINDRGIGGIDWRMPLAVVGAGLAGGAMGLGADSLGGATEGSALTGTMDTAGSAGFGGTTPLGAPVTDLSVAAQQPSMWQQMLTNMQNGKGVLGMGNQLGLNGGQRAGAGLLAQLLARGQGQGAKK